ncbi:MAG: divalent metal cation transporter [Runella slithyformis]|jgi:manganese transport protein|nr:MAG: divalent metal cation transporter [Runella slithyformis]TAF93509.1 MAG: divalent metal cation transporter [Runella sp.]TAG20020.1 MAG: divalent metal cation transporter [Cytophagales bacterium]TAG38041.1 MAG: divalent metal cation transporter [Cytophagia bacterium]TAE92648.1 MAG: divalent metal cation transporter [Runella slithyformis]
MSHPSSKQSLAEVHSSVSVPESTHFWRNMRAYVGPGLMVAVGYMDPGNWATDIAGGARFGYALLSVILFSSLFAMLLQHLALKLGIATGMDLAQACRAYFSKPVAFGLWVLAEIAIAACDLAEVIGSAIALNLLFHIPLEVGVVITTIDVLLILYFQKKGFRFIELIVGGMVGIILLCFIYEVIVSQPDWFGVVGGLVPRPQIITNPSMLYVGIGILGATVMPHNLYLHSSIVQTRNYPRTEAGKQSAIKYATIDSTVSLGLAFFINASILILSAAAFHFTGNRQVADITDAHRLLDALLGADFASILFAVALLAAGQSATITGTLAGQIVMEGFLDLKIKPWLRQLITRLIAIVPALFVAIKYGQHGSSELLVLSQVVLSFQLSFAVLPLIWFTSKRDWMGRFTNSPLLQVLSWVVGLLIAFLNIWSCFKV